jgi:hypothetical protein
MRQMGLVIYVGDTRNVCCVLVGKPKAKKLLLRTRHRQQSNTYLDLNEIRYE